MLNFKLQWLAGYLAKREMAENSRVGIMVQWPAIGWKISGFLAIQNFKVRKLTAVN
jgi:hypothetical protein